jgi:DNA uptake protein ComE-like DNA-binding protein
LKEKLFLDSLSSQWKLQQEKIIPIESEIPVLLFKFDPNRVTEEELISLGFSNGLAQRLLNYRKKGGTFHVKSDVKKIYGMDSVFFERLAPFIQLPETIEKTFPKNESVAVERKKPERFDLNEADTSRLVAIYGIGPVLARRIVLYREKLGGFVNSRQLGEVYGLDSASVHRLLNASFLRDSISIRKININTAGEEVLANHPYFTQKLAKAVVTYRFQHGKFHSLDDLRRIHLLEDKVLEKIYPYLVFDE